MDASFMDDGGWGGDTSFSSDIGPKDTETKGIEDKLLIPSPISTLSELSQECLSIGTFNFKSVQTIGRIESYKIENEQRQIVLVDPEDPDSFISVVTYDELNEDDLEGLKEGLVYAAGKIRKMEDNIFIMAIRIRELSDELEYEAFKREVEIALHYHGKNISAVLRERNGNVPELEGSACAALEGYVPSSDAGKAPQITTHASIGVVGGVHVAPQTSGKSQDSVRASELGKKVLKVLEENSAQIHQQDERKDISIFQIMRRLNIPPSEEDKVRGELAELMNEGYVFSAVDDDHFDLV